MKIKLFVVAVLLLFSPLYVVMHEFVHVIQYTLLYGDSLTSVSMYFLDGKVSEYGIPCIAHTHMTANAHSIISNFTPIAKHLFYEIPAYTFMVLCMCFMWNISKCGLKWW